MNSEKFRRQLRREATDWRRDGLINDSLYEQLANRYQFDRLEVAAHNRFTLILISLGCILLGLGVITFVAANWQVWPRTLRVGLLLSLFIGINLAGFSLWRLPLDRWQSRLGEGLLLLGALVLGANMALMGQMFHVQGSAADLLLTWGVGVLVMAYSLRLRTLGMLAILLVGLGYWFGWGESLQQKMDWLAVLRQQMPLLAGAMYLPLVYLCRSRSLFLFAAIAITTALINSLTTISFTSGWMVALALILPAALLWAYEDSFWGDVLRRPVVQRRSFRPLARALAIVYLGGLFYLGSFHGLWQSSATDAGTPLYHLQLLISAVALLALACLEWLYLLRLELAGPRDPTTPVIAGMLTVAGLALVWHLQFDPIVALATFLYNVLLFILGAGLVRVSLERGDRRAFWLGILLLTLQILSRLLEYETHLLFKSLVFVLCGFGVIAAGLWFERYLRRLSLRLPDLPEVPDDTL